MSNQQARLIGTAIALLAGSVAANAEALDVNVGIAIIVGAGALFVVEDVRCQKD